MGGTFKWEIHKNVKKNKIGRLCWEICEKKKNCPTLLHSPLPTKSRTAERNSREKPFLGSLPLSHFSLELNDIFFVGSYTGRVFYDFFRNFLITKRVIFVTMPKSLHMAKRSSREWGYFGAV